MQGLGGAAVRRELVDGRFDVLKVPHHGSANEMANIALQNAQSDAVLGLAQRIIMMQADEMHDFKDWLRTRQ